MFRKNYKKVWEQGDATYSEGGKTGEERSMAMEEALFRGYAAALATPFRDGEVDFEALAALTDRQLEAEADALVVCGTTGEPPTLTDWEKDAILSLALERVGGRIPVIAGAGSNSTADAVRRCLRAQSLGADMVLVVTPYYNKTTQSGLMAHFLAIAEAVDTPVILYNVPSRTGVNLLPETAARLAEHPNICGLKEASGNVAQAAETMALAGEGLRVYSGNDDQILPLLALGARGVISVAANVVPEAVRALVWSWFQGDARASREWQMRLLPLCRQLFCEVNPIPVKAALAMLGLCREEVRLPLVPLSRERREPLRRALRDLGLRCDF